ncbi:metalloproteinase inhibitor 1 isoform X2 [Anabrus simplex]
MQRVIFTIAATAALVLINLTATDGCSCTLTHPQESYCNANFVIVARVKKFYERRTSKVFKIRIKRTFKVSNNKTAEALQTGLLWTALDGAACGTHLNVNTTYLVAGNVVQGRPRVSLCSYVRPWVKLTNKQRKGFRLLYKNTCNRCEVIFKHWSQKEPVRDPKACMWDTASYPGDVELPDCQALYAICTVQPGGKCGWTSDRLNKECAKLRNRLRQEQLAREP